MRTAKHTPGRWTVGAECTDLIAGEPGGRFHGIDAPGHGALAIVVTQMEGNDPNGSSDERLIANARLIAAAPEMRALLCSICDSANEAEEYAAIQAAEVLLARVDDTEVAA